MSSALYAVPPVMALYWLCRLSACVSSTEDCAEVSRRLLNDDATPANCFKRLEAPVIASASLVRLRTSTILSTLTEPRDCVVAELSVAAIAARVGNVVVTASRVFTDKRTELRDWEELLLPNSLGMPLIPGTFMANSCAPSRPYPSVWEVGTPGVNFMKRRSKPSRALGTPHKAQYKFLVCASLKLPSHSLPIVLLSLLRGLTAAARPH